LRRAYFGLQRRRMERFEREACSRFDVVAAVSEQDAAHFREHYQVRAPVAIPTGVDTEYFRPDGHGTREERHLVFTGSMDWMPNEDGILFFADEVMPLLRAKVPGVRLTIVGRSPTPRLLMLGATHSDIILTGRVPDVRPYLARATASVVPLRIGGGTRLKIYEAMAMECPVISTAVGAEGLPLRKDRDLLIADDPAALAAACAALLLDREKARDMALAAATLVRKQFGWRTAAQAFVSACTAAADAHQRSRADARERH
jgi:glycosyltransferase involved in cell wall biosynthesis